MDEFAQSREDDDLFADELEPISAPTAVVEQTQPEHLTAESRPAPISKPATQPQQQQRNGRGQGDRGGSDRRARGGGRGGSNGLGQSRYAPQADSNSSQSQAAPPPPTTTPPSSTTTTTTTSTTTQSDPAPPPTPAAPQTADSTRTHAVRGDRSATGGPAHKKLTEAELTEKMAKMAILNAERAEKHRLTEADQAAFQHREKELAKERREKAIAEKKNERVMEMERAKNRERKMKAQGGREWDSEKLESDIVDGRGRGRSSEYVRGGHGGVIRGSRGGLAASKYSVDDGEDTTEPQGSRGRGGFEIRGRGRGGRGGRGGKQNTAPSAEDFPSLPTTAKLSGLKTATGSEENVKSPATAKPAGDWAEEMATPIEEKKLEV